MSNFSIESILRSGRGKRDGEDSVSEGKSGRENGECFTVVSEGGLRNNNSNSTETSEETNDSRDLLRRIEPANFTSVIDSLVDKDIRSDKFSSFKRDYKTLARHPDKKSVSPIKNMDSKIPRKTKDSEIPGNVEKLRWLEYTRYRPPKIPRRSVISRDNRRRPSVHPRIPFSTGQIQFLEEKFRKNVYLTKEDLLEISNALSLPENRVKIWFQNRRAKVRRESQNQDLTE